MYQEYFIIRRKSDCWFMPETQGGYSHNEPTKQGVVRLHGSEKSAQATLTQWLRGHHLVSYCRDEGQSFAGVEPVASRKREDMEIVKVIIKVVT
jgi:hypothetical protein